MIRATSVEEIDKLLLSPTVWNFGPELPPAIFREGTIDRSRAALPIIAQSSFSPLCPSLVEVRPSEAAQDKASLGNDICSLYSVDKFLASIRHASAGVPDSVRSKNKTWLTIADSAEGRYGLDTRKAGSGRFPVRKRSG
jgi:hypothetical protein